LRALLLCRTGDDAGLAHRLVGERVVIGRSQECDVSLLDDCVSRRHAQIVERDGTSWIEDLGSQGGTEVNGGKVSLGEEAPLAHFDVIRLGGGIELVWLELARVPATEVVAAALVGPGGERVPLRVGDNSLGSGDQNDLIVPDASVKSSHACVTLSARGLSIAPVDPGASFKVNGVQVGQADLEDGDLVELSPTAEFGIEVFCGSASSEAPEVTALGSTSPPSGPDSERGSAGTPADMVTAEAKAASDVAPRPGTVSPASASGEPITGTVNKPSKRKPDAVEAAGGLASTASVVARPKASPPSDPKPAAAGGAWALQEAASHPPGDAATEQVRFAEVHGERKEVRDRKAALLAQASAEDTGKGRVAELQMETLDLGASMHRPPMPQVSKGSAGPRDFKAARREAAVRVHVQAPDTETRTTLLREGRHVVGRTETCRVVVSHPSVSREHAEINVGPQGVRVRDLGSSNGTRKGSQRVTELAVAFGERIAFGDVTAWFESL
jgi:pSer/pThr/pTyr-binding forkhead associated (FHA) protein